METPNNKSVRKRLGISRNSSIKKNPLHNLVQNSPLTPSPRVNLRKSVQDLNTEQIETVSSTLCTPLIDKIKLTNKDPSNTPETPSEIQKQQQQPHSSNSFLSAGSSTIRRKNLSLRSNKISNNQIRKKKLDFVGSSEQQPPVVESRMSFENEFSLADSDSDLELSSITLPSEKILSRQEAKPSDIEELKNEIHDLQKQIEIFEKRLKEKETLKELIQLWKRAGIEGLDMLVVKTDPPQSIDNVLKCFNIPKKLLFDPD